MNLKSILVGIDGLKAKGNLDLEISSVECDYRAVKQGSLFVAIKGFEVDGHLFITKAIEKGAKAVYKKGKEAFNDIGDGLDKAGDWAKDKWDDFMDLFD